MPATNHEAPYADFRTEGSIVPDRLIIEPGLARKVVIPAGSGIVERGTVLGKITASGKSVAATSAATNGSQTADMILADTVDASGTDDVEAIGFYTGRYNTNALTLGAGMTMDAVDAAFRGKGIYLETSMT